MKSFLLALLFIPYCLCAHLGAKERVARPAVAIKVLLNSSAASPLIETKGRYYIYNSDNGAIVTITSSAKCDALNAVPNGLKWGDELYPRLFRATLVPDTGSRLLINGVEYCGNVHLEARKDVVCIVNEVEVEEYLASTLCMQVPPHLELEALEAAAIAARTHCYYIAQRQGNQVWHATAAELGYEGSWLMGRYTPIERAIAHTRQMVLFYEDQPFPATFTRHCAGKTADYTTIFRRDAKMPKSVDAPLAAEDKQKVEWTFEISKKALAQRLGVTRIDGLDLYTDRLSNKVYGMRVKERNKDIVMDFFKLQMLLGPTHIKSTEFVVKRKGQNLIFTGYGEGHGVGLCLYTANCLAKNGERAPQILSTFFPGCELRHCAGTK